MVGFPLLLIPIAIYNIIVFLMPGVSLAEPMLKLTLPSGAEWPVNLSDILLAVGIVLLLSEVIKGARPGAKYLTDHLLSLIVTGAAAAEFVMWSKFGNSTYFLLTLLSLVDFFAGIALRTRRHVQVQPAIASKRASKKIDPGNLQSQSLEPAAEPRFDPAPLPARSAEPPPVVEPASQVPLPPSVAEQREPTPAPPSPEVPSPGLQPGHAPSPDTPPR